MTRLQMLTAVRRGLTNPKNFDGNEPNLTRPHCVLGEFRWQGSWDYCEIEPLFTLPQMREMGQIGDQAITHPRALHILDAAIKREKNRVARERSR